MSVSNLASMTIFSIYEDSDCQEIQQLFIDTFTDSEGKSEGQVLGKLSRDLIINTDPHDLYVFVAKEAGQVIGCIFFSRITLSSSSNAFLLSPVAVNTGYQGRGIGQKLINHGIQQLKKEGVSLIVTYGDPAFYSKVGFKPISEQLIRPPHKLSQPEGWLGLRLDGDDIADMSGDLSCVKAFDNPQLW
jgi:predicted N-acetyltransferase YhbS